MKKIFAIPMESGKLCAHFGHCEKFAIVETMDNKVTKEDLIDPPVHQPGVYQISCPTGGSCNTFRRNGPAGPKSFCSKRHRGMHGCRGRNACKTGRTIFR